MKKSVLRGGFLLFVFLVLMLVSVNINFVSAEDMVLGRISMICGLTNGHSSDGIKWEPDPGCIGGCTTRSDPAGYCKKFWPDTEKAIPFDASEKGKSTVFGPDYSKGIQDCSAGVKPNSATAEYKCAKSATASATPPQSPVVQPPADNTPNAPTIICGNGRKDSGEECDDGNKLGGDGCDDKCMLEKPTGLTVSFDTEEKKATLNWRDYEGLFSSSGQISNAAVFKSVTGSAAGDTINGNAVDGQKTGFFERILNFFKWLFGMKTVGVSMGNNGYAVYRTYAGSNQEIRIGFIPHSSCLNGICSYIDDTSKLGSGDYYYAVSVVFGGIESRKSTPISVDIPEEVTSINPPPANITPVQPPATNQTTPQPQPNEPEPEPVYNTVNEYAPVLNAPNGIGNKIVKAGEKLSFISKGEDDDGNRLTYSVRRIRFEDWSETDAPSGVQLDESTGQFAWSTNNADAGNYIFKFSVSDGKFTDSEVVYVNVYEPGAMMCNYASEGLYAPYGACFEKKPLYCDFANGVRYNCTDCGCPKTSGTNFVCESSGNCVVPYDCMDKDGDGFFGADAGCPATIAKDCDDNNPNINPSAVEICSDGKDNDCDGQIDEADCKGIKNDG